MKQSETNKILALVRENWPNHPWSDHADQIWHLALADVPYETVNAVLPRLFREQKFPPVPADIVALLGVRESDQWSRLLPNGEQTWEEIRAQIKYPGSWGTPVFSHPLIERTMRTFGWQELCQCPADQLNTLRAQVERFGNKYRDDAIDRLRQGATMEDAVLPFGEQQKIAGLVPAGSPVPELEGATWDE